jgi:type II secretory ATPase GspE/PulE/Tfp pilus assembly ATPase PilB-like protein
MAVTSNIKTAIRDQRSGQEIQELACQEGMVTLEDYGRALVRDGITSVAELQRLCSSAFD